MNLSQALQTWYLWLSANGYSQTTITMYRWALALLESRLGDPLLRQIRPEDMDSFWSWLRNDYQPTRASKKTDPLSGRSLENVWTAQRSFFGWCIETGKLKRRPDEHIRRPEYAEREIQPFTEEEISRLLDAARFTRLASTTRRVPFRMARPTAARDSALIMLLADTGMRVSECARLTRADFDFNASTVTIRAFGTGRKTKERTLDIGKQTRLAVWEYILWREGREGAEVEPDETLFLSLPGNSMNKDSIRQVLHEIGLSAGIPDVHPHRFRHFYTSQRAADGAGEYELLHDLGQTSSRMPRRYVHMHRVTRAKRPSPVDRIKKGRR